MRTLLGLGADPLRRNGAGESAVDCARRLGLAHLVSAMETHVRSKEYWRNHRCSSRGSETPPSSTVFKTPS